METITISKSEYKKLVAKSKAYEKLAKSVFEDAIKVVAYTDGLDTLDKLKTINETKVLRQIVKDGDELAKKRIQSILDSPTLSDKK